MALIDRIKRSAQGSDSFQTPLYPLEMLNNYLSQDLLGCTVWDPCCGKGNIVKFFKDRAVKAHGSDLETGHNFLGDDEHYKNNLMDMWDYDCIITNPPYSLKNDFLDKCYELNKPFALLLPMTALGSKDRYHKYKKMGISIGLMQDRVNFHTPSGKGSGAWFDTAWFMWGWEPTRNEIIYLE